MVEILPASPVKPELQQRIAVAVESALLHMAVNGTEAASTNPTTRRMERLGAVTRLVAESMPGEVDIDKLDGRRSFCVIRDETAAPTVVLPLAPEETGGPHGALIGAPSAVKEVLEDHGIAPEKTEALSSYC